ncbi:MAG: ice-binding family protein [Dietzia sp.]
MTTTVGVASAAHAPVELGTADSFAVLAGSTVTNTGPSTIAGDLGLSPGSSVTGFPPGTVTGGTQHVSDSVAIQAKADLTTAYDDAAGRAVTGTVSADLGGQTFVDGTYFQATDMALTGTVTLNAQNNPNAVFIFQAADTLTIASGGTVELVNGANPCNVFWQVGASATLGTNSTFVGTVMALTSITVNTGATVQGRLLARNGAVTLDNNVITAPDCEPPTTTTPPTTTEPTDTTEPTTPTTTETTDPDDSTTPTTGTTDPSTSVPTTPTTTGPSEPTTPTTSVPAPPTTVPNVASGIPLLPILLPAILIGGSVAAAPIVGPMIGQSLGDLGFSLPALPEFPPLAGSAMPGPGPVQPVAPAPMAPGPESPNGRGGEPGAMGDVTGPVAADTAGTAVLTTGSMGDFELPLPSGVRLPPLPFIR